MLTKHIAEHDNLPEVAGVAISQALAGEREEQRQQYQTALDAAKKELGEQTQANLQKALDGFQTALFDAKAELSEQTQISLAQACDHLQTAMAAHKTELHEQAQASLNQGLVFSQSRSVRIEAMHLGSGVLGGETPGDLVQRIRVPESTGYSWTEIAESLERTQSAVRQYGTMAVLTHCESKFQDLIY